MPKKRRITLLLQEGGQPPPRTRERGKKGGDLMPDKERKKGKKKTALPTSRKPAPHPKILEAVDHEGEGENGNLASSRKEISRAPCAGRRGGSCVSFFLL